MALEAPELQAYQMTGLPMLVTSPVDIGRLIRELEQIDSHVDQLTLGKPAGQTVTLPKMSQLMERTVEINKLRLTEATERQRLQQFLETIKAQAPVLHISFSADPSTAFIEKLMTWLRREIHPLVLMKIGLQPTIGAGCIVRSTNKYFDMSLRQDFMKNQASLREVLAPALAGTTVSKPTAAVAVAMASPVAPVSDVAIEPVAQEAVAA